MTLSKRSGQDRRPAFASGLISRGVSRWKTTNPRGSSACSWCARGSEGMMRRVASAALAFSFILAGARPALAHGFGPTYDIPIPLWLYLYGAAAAVVVLAFVPLALFSGKERDADAAYRYPRFDLFRFRRLRKVMTSRILTGGLRLLSVVLFFVVV